MQYCTKDHLKREIRLQRRLNYQHVLKLFDKFEDNHNAYLVLEYAENGSLF
jgi:serine/threonine protein kinase